MKTIGNIIWLLFGGLLLALGWAIAGVILCLTIVFIPVGIQCFKFAELMLAPFGRKIVYSGETSSIVLNIFWVIIFGVHLAVASFVIGILWCITIVGIPVGLQCFKFAGLALMPFGTTIE